MCTSSFLRRSLILLLGLVSNITLGRFKVSVRLVDLGALGILKIILFVHPFPDFETNPRAPGRTHTPCTVTPLPRRASSSTAGGASVAECEWLTFCWDLC